MAVRGFSHLSVSSYGFPAASRDFRGAPRQLTSFATLLEVFRVCGGDGDGDDGDGINFGLVLHSFGFDFHSFWLHLGSILVPFWSILAPFWDPRGVPGRSSILGRFCELLGVPLGSLLAPFWHHFGITFSIIVLLFFH